MSLGIESGDDETLQKIAKGTTVEKAKKAIQLCREENILTLGYFMLGFPWEDEGRIRQSFRGFLEIDPDLMEVLFPYPFPGTPIRQEMLDEELIQQSTVPRNACARPAAPTPWLTEEDLLRLRGEFIRKFYLRAKVIRRLTAHTLGQGTLRGLMRMGLKATTPLARSAASTFSRVRAN